MSQYDYDRQGALLFATYLAQQFDPLVAQGPPQPLPAPDDNDEQNINTDCLIVTFYDPMSIDEANRIIVMCDEAETDVNDPGSVALSVEIGIRSRWRQDTIKADFDQHFARERELGKWIFDQTIVDKLETARQMLLVGADPGITTMIDFIQPKKYINRVTTTDYWIYYTIKFAVQGHNT